MPWTDLTASQPIRAWLFNPTQPRRLLIAGWSNAAWSTAAVVALAVTHDPILVAWWVLGSEPLLVAVIYRWTEKSSRAATGEQGAHQASGGPPDPARAAEPHCWSGLLGSNPDVGRTSRVRQAAQKLSEGLLSSDGNRRDCAAAAFPDSAARCELNADGSRRVHGAGGGHAHRRADGDRRIHPPHNRDRDRRARLQAAGTAKLTIKLTPRGARRLRAARMFASRAQDQLRAPGRQSDLDDHNLAVRR